MPYDMRQRRCGRYASRLERDWADRFKVLGWDAEYIGHVYWGADFKIDGLRVEVKPLGMEFVQQACDRGGCDVIIEGDPLLAAWWVIDGLYAKRLVDARDGHALCTPLCRNGKTESLHEFIQRGRTEKRVV